MTTRTWNALRRAEVADKEDLISQLEVGIEVRGIGHKAKKEIEDYVGFPIDLIRESKKITLNGRMYRAWVSRIRRA